MDHIQTVEVEILNAFVDNNAGGNPAGVVLNADHLSSLQKLKIAKAVGLSETAFVSKSSSADFKLDFFTPKKQIAHCGHATIATFSYLNQLGKIPHPQTSKETIDGNRRVRVSDSLAFMEQKAPSYTDLASEKEQILASLSLDEGDLMEDAPLSIVNTGNSFLTIAVANTKVLKNIQPDFNIINEMSEKYDLIGYYVFTLDVEDENRDASTRMFAPRYGIIEEAATGMAAGPLACYLYDKLLMKKRKFMIQQGKFMEAPSISLILTELEIVNDEIVSVMAGGRGMAVSKKTIDLSQI